MFVKLKFSILFLMSVLCAFVSGISTTTLNQYFKICHRSDPQLNRCMKESIEKLKPFLKTGIPELSIPAIEPLIIPEITLNQGKSSAINLMTQYRDLNLWGLSKFELKDFHANIENNQIRFRILFPRLVTKGQYNIRGKVLMLPIMGSGRKEGNYTNVEGNVLLHGRPVEHARTIYYHIHTVSIDLDVEDASIYFDNLFNGDKQLGDAMNLFINDNWKHVMKDMKPVLEQSIGDVVKNLFNAVYNKFPLNQILPY